MNLGKVNLISSSFRGTDAVINSPFNAFNAVESKPTEEKSDSVEIAQNQKEPPKIGFFRLAFRRLTKEQVKQINETGLLPKNAKFRRNSLSGDTGYSYTIQNNIFNITNGTRQLPEGYEVKNNILGFTRVVPKGTEGFWIKNKKD